MDRHGIDQAALMPAHGYATPRGAADTRAVNDDLLAYAGLAPSRFPVLVGTVEPRHGAAALAEVGRLHDMGCKGVSWHHRMQGLPMDHPVMFSIFEAMAERGMIAMIHCYAQGDFEAPWRLRRLAECFPEVPVVALDAMTSPENLEQLLATAALIDNVHLGLTTTSLGAKGINDVVRIVGARRLLFGTNHYGTGTPDRLMELEAIEAAVLDDEQRRLILGGNGRALFGIMH